MTTLFIEQKTHLITIDLQLVERLFSRGDQLVVTEDIDGDTVETSIDKSTADTILTAIAYEPGRLLLTDFEGDHFFIPVNDVIAVQKPKVNQGDSPECFITVTTTRAKASIGYNSMEACQADYDRLRSAMLDLYGSVHCEP